MSRFYIYISLALLVLVVATSFRMDGYYRDSMFGEAHPGDGTAVTLIVCPQRPLMGLMDSFRWALSQSDSSADSDLLPNISPTFEWNQLAQRAPMPVHYDPAPPYVEFPFGTTASVLVMK